MGEVRDDLPESTSTKALSRYLPAEPFLSSQSSNWENVLLRCYRFPPRPEGITLPRIPDHTLILHLGKPLLVRRQINGECPWDERVIFPGALTIWPAQTVSTWVYTEVAEALHLHVAPQLIQQAAKASEEERSSEEDRFSVRFVCCLGEVDPIAEHTLLLLKSLLERPQEAKEVVPSAEALVHLLAEHLTKTYGRAQEETSFHSGELSRPRLRRVSEYVRTHLGEDLTVEDMAAVINISPHHFSRLFRATTGETPYQFVMRQRLEEAERLLLETDAPIAEIAERVGHRDASHFASIFRRRTGLTPRAYRRQYRA